MNTLSIRTSARHVTAETTKDELIALGSLRTGLGRRRRASFCQSAISRVSTALATVTLLLCVLATPSVAHAQIDPDDDMLLTYLPAILADTRNNTQSGGGGSSGGGGDGGSDETPTDPVTIGPGVSADEATLTVKRNGDRLTVSSNARPTWRVVFEIGSGAPGGGTATSLFIPASSNESVVENRPFMNCCSGLGLDNLEWRWRPFGSGTGTRAALGTSSVVDSFRINSQTSTSLEFTLRGRWSGVSAFTRRNVVNVKGYSSQVSATYAGQTGQDSMWWLIAMFHEKDLKSKKVTIEDGDTSPIVLRKTTVGTPIPGAISFPYKINYPLRSGYDATLTMTRLGDTTSGNSRYYEFFDSGLLHGSINLGPYYIVYPRWIGVLQSKTYSFNYKWKFTN